MSRLIYDTLTRHFLLRPADNVVEYIPFRRSRPLCARLRSQRMPTSAAAGTQSHSRGRPSPHRVSRRSQSLASIRRSPVANLLGQQASIRRGRHLLLAGDRDAVGSLASGVLGALGHGGAELVHRRRAANHCPDGRWQKHRVRGEGGTRPAHARDSGWAFGRGPAYT